MLSALRGPGFRGVAVKLLEVHGRLVAESRVPPPRVGPALDVPEDGHPCFALGLEPIPVQELTFERREK